MTSRPDVLALCPSRSPVARSAASLRRVPWGGFPDFTGSISGLRPLPAHPASLRCLRSGVPPIAPFAPRSRGAAPGPGPLLPRRPGRLLAVETGRSPKFLGDPCLHALLFDPGGPLASGHSDARDVAFRIYNYVGSASGLSRLNHTAYRLPVYASQPRSPPHHATLGSGCWPALAGSGPAPAGSLRRFPSWLFPYITSSFTKLCLAQYIIPKACGSSHVTSFLDQTSTSTRYTRAVGKEMPATIPCIVCSA